MFSVFSLKKENPLTDSEVIALHKLLEYYINTSQGQWLEDIPWRVYKFYWSEAMRDGGVMGAFAPSKGRAIFLMPTENNGEQWLECIASTIVHELRHAWQFETQTTKYVFSSLPLVREITLERDAKKIQKASEPIFTKLSSDRAARAFEERLKKYK